MIIMKLLKTMIFLSVGFVCTYSSAQESVDSSFSEYKYFIGGGFGYSSQTDKVDNTNNVNFDFKNWEISPRVGIRTSKNIELGLSLTYERNLGINESSSQTLGGSLFSRYFFFNKSNFSMNFSGSVGYSIYNNILDNRPNQELRETDINQFILRCGIDAEYKITSRLRVRSSLFRLSNNWYQTKRSNSIDTHGSIFRTETIFTINSSVSKL